MSSRNFFDALHMRSGRVFSPVGSKTKVDYQLDIEPDGNRRLVETGVTDRYAIIQSHKAECTIENILKRFEAGDTSVLQRVQGVYADTTVFPKDLITANEAIKNAERLYKSLPSDVRAQYQGFDDFVRTFGTYDGIADFCSKFTKNDDAAASDPAVGGVQDEQTT